MRRRPFFGAAAAAALAGTAAASGWAQGAGVKHVGWLSALAPDNPASVAMDAFYDVELKRLGWDRERNLISLHRHGPRDAKGWDLAARELVDAGVDVIGTFSDNLLRAAARATRSIPIVALSGAIVEYGFAQSLARPDGNVTGVVSQSHEFSGRVFALLGNIRPGTSLVGVPVDPAELGLKLWFESVEAAAASAGMRVVALPLPRAPADIAPMLDAAKRAKVQALRMWFLPVLSPAVWQQISAWAIEHRVVTLGTLLSRGEAVVCFGPELQEQARLHAGQIDRVLRGARLAETPNLQPTRWEIVVNQKLARAVGWPAPRAVLLQATEVIE